MADKNQSDLQDNDLVPASTRQDETADEPRASFDLRQFLTRMRDAVTSDSDRNRRIKSVVGWLLAHTVSLTFIIMKVLATLGVLSIPVALGYDSAAHMMMEGRWPEIAFFWRVLGIDINIVALLVSCLLHVGSAVVWHMYINKQVKLASPFTLLAGLWLFGIHLPLVLASLPALSVTAPLAQNSLWCLVAGITATGPWILMRAVKHFNQMILKARQNVTE